MAGIYSKPIIFSIVAVLVILSGTLASTIIPMFVPSTQPLKDYIKPYTSIELEGRDIYIREGCNNCHTQTVRPVKADVRRFDPNYLEYTKPEESYYDRPFLWGSRRIGPDLMSFGRRVSDNDLTYHYKHLANPQMMPGSNMPPYKWLAERKLDTGDTAKKISVFYMFNPEVTWANSKAEIDKQIGDYKAKVTAKDYKGASGRDEITPESLRGEITEMDALVAYLYKLGRDMKDVYEKQK